MCRVYEKDLSERSPSHSSLATIRMRCVREMYALKYFHETQETVQSKEYRLELTAAAVVTAGLVVVVVALIDYHSMLQNVTNRKHSDGKR